MAGNEGTENPRWRGLAGMVAAIAAAVGVVAAIGVFGRGDGSTVTFETVRGEVVDHVITGVYAHNPERLVSEGIGWDLFTLFVAVPALLAVVPAVARGSLRGRLFAIGMLAYVFYQYLMYAMAWAAGPLLLPFVVITATSLVAIALLTATVSPAVLAEHVTDRFPRRSMMVLSGVFAVLLPVMWVPLILAVARGEVQGVLHGQMTLVVQAMDLGLVVPLAVLTVATLWRRRPVGYLLAAAMVVKAVAMAAAIVAMVVSAWRVEGHLDAGGLVIFAAGALAAIVIAVRMYGAISERPVGQLSAP